MRIAVVLLAIGVVLGPALGAAARAAPATEQSRTSSPAPSTSSERPPAAAPPNARVGTAADENDDNDNAARRARVNATTKLDVAGGTVKVVYPLLPASGPDAAALAKLADGAVLDLTRSLAIKLSTTVELDFAGGAVARPGNVTPGYPGVYSLWLKRSGDQWRLVLNREPDVWGTMRDPAADTGETALQHSTLPDAEAHATLEARLAASNGGGTLTVFWGVHRFVAQFDAAKGATP